VSDGASPTVGKLQIRPLGQEGFGLQSHGTPEADEHPRNTSVSGSSTSLGLTKADNIGGLFHRRIALSGEVLAGLDTGLDTPPFSGHHHPNSA